MGPNDYILNTAAPFQAFAQGYQGGAAIRDDQFAQQQQQTALAQQQQLLQARQAAISNPTATNFSTLMLLDPKSAEASQKAWETRNTEQQQSLASDLGSYGAALVNKQPQIVADGLNRQADLIEQQTGGPTPDSQSKRALAQVALEHPELALGKIIAVLKSSKAGGPVADSLLALMTKPAEVAKANADASSATTKAAVDAAAAPDVAAKPGIDNAKTQADMRIAELNTQIAQANSETDRGRLTLERDKLVQEQALAKQSRGQAAQDSQDSVTQALQTLDQIKTHPGLDSHAWYDPRGLDDTNPGTLWGQVMKRLPGTDRNALETYVDSLKGQLGYQALLAAKAASPTGASGFGALSEGELKLLSNLAGNLDTSSKDFPKQLSNVEKYLTKMQSKITASPSVPTAGGAFVMNTPRYGVVDEGRVNSLLKQFPGSTRAQVLQFLQAQGK
jgi:hypothetical protein